MIMNMDIAGVMTSHIGNIQSGVTIIVALGILAMDAMRSGAIGTMLVGGNMKLDGVIEYAESLRSKQSIKIHQLGNC